MDFPFELGLSQIGRVLHSEAVYAIVAIDAKSAGKYSDLRGDRAHGKSRDVRGPTANSYWSAPDGGAQKDAGT